MKNTKKNRKKERMEERKSERMQERVKAKRATENKKRTNSSIFSVFHARK